jgi:hypothetical protein
MDKCKFQVVWSLVSAVCAPCASTMVLLLQILVATRYAAHARMITRNSRKELLCVDSNYETYATQNKKNYKINVMLSC